jgi:hypothetical protein|tara:strand:- start:42 stop:968 length:927 start_codon:yes stop_codon:yes gene_type:complete
MAVQNYQIESPRLIILTGPQGSGNHLWSKIFNSHPSVNGWDMQGKYWQGHHRETFAECWNKPALFKTYDYKQYNVTSISNPYVAKGKHRVPKYDQVFKALDARGVEYSVIQLGRDGNILQHQQTRLRKKITLDLESFPEADFFLSYELLQLYGAKYIETIAYNLDFPIDVGDAVKHLEEDTNAKYIKAHEGVTDTDRLVALAINESKIDFTKLYEPLPDAPSTPEIVKAKGPTKATLKKMHKSEQPKPTRARQEADKRREERLARVASEEAATLKKEKNAIRAKKAAATRAKNKAAKEKAAKIARKTK